MTESVTKLVRVYMSERFMHRNNKYKYLKNSGVCACETECLERH
jgi:hypothetical protein